MNPHDGAVLLEHAGRTARITFDWQAIEAIRAEWGDEYVARMDKALSGGSLADVAWMVAQASGQTQAEVMKWSPPIVATNAALTQAWQRAWFGAETPDKGDASNPLNALTMLQAFSGRLLKRRSGQASAGATSGA